MERRGFLSKIFALPLLAVPAARVSTPDGPVAEGTPFCQCGSLMYSERGPNGQFHPVHLAYCTNRRCQNFEVRYRVKGTPLERA